MFLSMQSEYDPSDFSATIGWNMAHIKHAKICLDNQPNNKKLGNDVRMYSCDDEGNIKCLFTHSTKESLKEHINIAKTKAKHDWRLQKFESNTTFKRFKHIVCEFDPMELLFAYTKSKFIVYFDSMHEIRSSLHEDLVYAKVYLHKHKAVADYVSLKSDEDESDEDESYEGESDEDESDQD